jgi:hypothetical protein
MDSTQKLNIQNTNQTVLPKLIKWSWIIIFISALFQLIFFWSIECLFATICILVSWKIFASIFLKQHIIETYPLSTLLVAGFTTTQLYFPLVFTLLEGKSVVYNLILPNEVFLHAIAAVVILSISHIAYRQISNKPTKMLRSILIKANFFQPPCERQIWLMGILGLVVMASSSFLSSTKGVEKSETLIGRLLWGLTFFVYSPYFLLLGKLYGSNQNKTREKYIQLLVFTLFLLIASIARNSRGSFIIGFTSLGLAYGLSLILGITISKFTSPRNLIIATISIWLLTGPVADIGSAMVLVRGQRGDVSSSELLKLTLEAYQDKQAIQAVRAIGLNEHLEWDETYMDNIFLARFCNIKYSDASLVLASKIGEQDEAMYERSIDFMLSTLPLPFLEALNIDIDKKELTNGSLGDFLYYRSSAEYGAIGSFRTGHFAGLGMVAFGLGYLLILGISIIPVYLLFDVMSGRARVVKQIYNYSGHVQTVFSFSILLSLTSVFMFLPSESVLATISFLFRGWFQLIILYFFIFHFSFFIVHPFRKSRAAIRFPRVVKSLTQ